jgi:colanic acid/amylovoran biosynthesis glycosyltransferase
MSAILIDQSYNVYNKIFDVSDILMPISNYWKRKLIILGCDEKKIIVHHMGINLDKFKFYEVGEKSRELIKILTVGRLVEKKGYEYMIRAIAKVVKKYRNIEYLIAGDGNLMNKLEELVSELNINNYVKFLGGVNQDEVLKLNQQAHIFILHSITAKNGDQEGIPVALMEAQATGLPIISTFHSGIPEIVLDGQSGFLVPERDVDAMAGRLEYLIEHTEIWTEMGRAGRKFVEENFDIKKLNKQLVEIYENII